jgi:hypothetical protein
LHYLIARILCSEFPLCKNASYKNKTLLRRLCEPAFGSLHCEKEVDDFVTFPHGYIPCFAGAPAGLILKCARRTEILPVLVNL